MKSARSCLLCALVLSLCALAQDEDTTVQLTLTDTRLLANSLPAECTTEPIIAQAVGFACPTTYRYIYDTRLFLADGFNSTTINYLSHEGKNHFTLATVSQETGSYANALMIMLDSGAIWRVV
jgi:hypothetical protein